MFVNVEVTFAEIIRTTTKKENNIKAFYKVLLVNSFVNVEQPATFTPYRDT